MGWWATAVSTPMRPARRAPIAENRPSAELGTRACPRPVASCCWAEPRIIARELAGQGGSSTTLHRSSPIQQYRRRSGTRVLGRWRHREPDHRSLAHLRLIRDRAQHCLQLQGKHIDLKQIGRELNVRYVLKGSVQRAGNRLRATSSSSTRRPARISGPTPIGRSHCDSTKSAL